MAQEEITIEGAARRDASDSSRSPQPKGSTVRTPTEWVRAAVPESAAALDEGELGPLAPLLARRGAQTLEDARSFLAPTAAALHDPMLLAGIPEAVARLEQAASGGERVAIVGDYDVDGVSASALLQAVLRACGIDTVAILPHRLRDGYGFQPRQVERALEEKCSVIVTVDCGTTSAEATKAALDADIDVIITDHHIAGSGLPEAAIQVNPRQPGCTYPFKDLAGVGIALKLAMALLEATGRKVPLAPLLRIACLGTIADVVPLQGENRVIAALGLRALSESKSPGLRALLDVAGVGKQVSASDVGFRIGPRINAAGRLSTAETALELLTTRDERRARSIAERLDAMNRERQGEELKAVDEARELFNERIEEQGLPGILVGWSEEWHRGVVGIAAGRLAREFHRPVLLLAVEEDSATGSGRSIPGVGLHDFVSRWSDQLTRFGGHHQAIGLTVELARLEGLREEWEAAATWPEDVLIRRYEYELELRAGEINEALFDTLRQLEPYGEANREPLIRVGDLEPLGEPRLFGNGHLKLQARDSNGATLPLLGWRWAGRAEIFDQPFEVVGFAEWDNYLARPILRLADARPLDDDLGGTDPEDRAPIDASEP